MGTSGTGTFDNDDAADFVGTLCDADDLSAVRDALDLEDGYLELDTAMSALAAAEVVAAMRTGNLDRLPEDLAEWVDDHLAGVERLVPRAREAVERVLEDSELAELWADSDDAHAWRKNLGALRAMLG